VCRGEKTDITVSTHTEGCTFKWYRTYMGSQPFASGPRLQVAPYADTCIYYVLVTSKQQCTAWDSVHAFMVIPTLRVDKNVICAGDSVTLFSGAADHYSWSASPSDPSLDAQLDSLTGFGPSRVTVHPSRTTTYTLVGHGTNGCSASPLKETVDVHPLPIAQYSCEPAFVDSDNPEVTFSDVSPHSVHALWYFPINDTAKEGSPLTHNFGELSDTSVAIRLVAYNDLGCTDTLDFSIPVVLFTFYAPNIFTPERADNNTFRIFTTNEMEHFHVTIYDRRGQMVYKSDDLNFEWDGTRMDGEKCPQGAYVYVITYRRPMTEDIVTQKGTVTIIR
jgi:gliding motility-associated-like protein